MEKNKKGKITLGIYFLKGIIMETGIVIVCEEGFGTILVTHQPYCIINRVKAIQLHWYKKTFISLKPNMYYQINIQFPFMGGAFGRVTFNVKVDPEVIQTYSYIAPWIRTSKGKIKRIDDKYSLVDEKQYDEYPQPHCPDCDSILKLILNKNKWYCNNCKIYPDIHPNIPENIRYGTKKGRRRFLLYFFGFVLSLSIVHVVFRFSDDFFIRTGAVVGELIVIIAFYLAFFIRRHILLKKM